MLYRQLWNRYVSFKPKQPKGYYANMPLQYETIFKGYKNDNFQMNEIDIFLIFAQNVNCGYKLEPP